MRIPVAWHTETPGEFARGWWDAGFLEDLFAGYLAPECPFTFEHYPGIQELPNRDGAIVMIPARWWAGREAHVLELLEPLAWSLVILIGDEEGSFDHDKLRADNRRIWVQTPHPGRCTAERVIGDFYPPGTRRILEGFGPPTRTLNWFFAGQLNNARRHSVADALFRRRILRGDGVLETTEVFGSGLSHEEYLRHLSDARVAPCPSGSFSPDTFRLFEALEAGCVPIVDLSAPNTDTETDYWQLLFDGDPPFAIIDDWADVDVLIEHALEAWPAIANRIQAWWLAYKQTIADRLHDDLETLAGHRAIPETADDLITVCVPTSPIASHPDTAILRTTIVSIRERLPRARILLLIDGVRAEQEAYRDAYEAYQTEALWLANHAWDPVVPIRFDQHTHQAGTMRRALEHVRTPLVLFVEHDTPLEGDWPLDDASALVLSGELNVLRFHHEAQIPAEHAYLMEGSAHTYGITYVRTRQWSQRPHLASTMLYRQLLDEHFAPDERHMIEDRLHGIVGESDWDAYRVGIYHPEGSIKRSGHLDGRGDDQKWVDS